MKKYSNTLATLEPVFRKSSRVSWRSSLSKVQSTSAASRTTALPVTNNAPTSSCDCGNQIPSDLDIDHSRPMANTIASYNQHVVISTGKSDWASRIEDEEGPGNMARAMKGMLKRGAEWHDPDRTSLISNSSFADPSASSQAQEKRAEAASTPHAKDSQPLQRFVDRGDANSTSLKLFPQFLDFPNISPGDPEHHRHFISSYLSSRSTTSPWQCPPGFTFPRPIDKITILICSHNTRDRRCGVIGPLLYQSFIKYADLKTTDVGMVSHVGGHAFAGNVIIYIPPGHKVPPSETGEKDHDTELSPLAGSGVWYGRVEPKHVQGILEETVQKGKIIGELWRGGLQIQHSTEMPYDSQSTSFEDWKKRAATAQMIRLP